MLDGDAELEKSIGAEATEVATEAEVVNDGVGADMGLPSSVFDVVPMSKPKPVDEVEFGVDDAEDGDGRVTIVPSESADSAAFESISADTSSASAIVPEPEGVSMYGAIVAIGGEPEKASLESHSTVEVAPESASQIEQLLDLAVAEEADLVGEEEATESPTFVESPVLEESASFGSGVSSEVLELETEETMEPQHAAESASTEADVPHESATVSPMSQTSPQSEEDADEHADVSEAEIIPEKV